ncbi:MAG: zf-HC2 domain-containing protein [bacterium]
MKHISKRKLSAFLDGEVCKEEKHRISEHVKSCASCQKEVDRLSYVSHSLDAMEEVQASPYFMLNLKQKIIERESKRAIRLWFLEEINRVLIPVLEGMNRILIPAGATALFLVSLLCGSYLGTSIYQIKGLKVLPTREGFDNFFSITLFDNFPEGSLGNAYALLSMEGERQ